MLDLILRSLKCLYMNINVGSVVKFLKKFKKSMKELNPSPVLIVGSGSPRSCFRASHLQRVQIVQNQPLPVDRPVPKDSPDANPSPVVHRFKVWGSLLDDLSPI